METRRKGTGDWSKGTGGAEGAGPMLSWEVTRREGAAKTGVPGTQVKGCR